MIDRHCNICGVYGGCWHTMNMNQRAQEDYARRMVISQINEDILKQATELNNKFIATVESPIKPNKKLLLLRRVP